MTTRPRRPPTGCGAARLWKDWGTDGPLGPGIWSADDEDDTEDEDEE